MYDVMLCDDESVMLELLSRNFNWSSLDLRVQSTQINGHKGLLYFAANKIDIAVADIRMPIMSGIEMARGIREIDKRARIIFLTSYDDFEYAQKAIDVNATAYVLKPLNDDEFRNALMRAVSDLRDIDSGRRNDEAAIRDAKCSLIIEEASQYVKQNIRKKLSLKEVAEHFSYSPNYLGHLFKEETGMYFNNYVAKCKIEVAAKMLRIPQNHMSDIADALGYTHVTYFIRQFKQYYGVTPKTYRDNEGVSKQ